MEPETFKAFQDLAYAKAGISLRQGKAALVQARLAKRLRELGLASEREYLERLRADSGEEVVLFLDAISTNFTRFFREPGQGEGENEGEDHQRQDGVFGGGGDRVGWDDRAQEVAEARNFADRRGPARRLPAAQAVFWPVWVRQCRRCGASSPFQRPRPARFPPRPKRDPPPVTRG